MYFMRTETYSLMFIGTVYNKHKNIGINQYSEVRSLKMYSMNIANSLFLDMHQNLKSEKLQIFLYQLNIDRYFVCIYV